MRRVMLTLPLPIALVGGVKAVVLPSAEVSVTCAPVRSPVTSESAFFCDPASVVYSLSSRLVGTACVPVVVLVVVLVVLVEPEVVCEIAASGSARMALLNRSTGVLIVYNIVGSPNS